MNTSLNPKNHNLQPFWLSLLIVIALACSCPLPQFFSPSASTEPTEMPQGQEPASGGVQVTFSAGNTSLQPGECTSLEWSTQGVEVVNINGEPAARSGQKQVCPQQTTTYTLAVYAAGGPALAEREIVIIVNGGLESPTKAPSQAPSVDCSNPPVVSYFSANPDTINAGQSTTISWDANSNTPAGALQTVSINQGVGNVGGMGDEVVKPNQTTTYTLTAKGCGGTTTKNVTVTVNSQAPAPPGGGSAGILTADLAVTDLFPDSYPQGSVYVRITNNGPGNPSNVEIQLSCTTGKNPYDGSPPSSSGSSGPLTISLNPGQTEAYNTGITIDGSINWYEVSCSVQVPFKDTNSSNDSYSETIPPPP